MKNLLHNIEQSEVNRILEMHEKHGYNTIKESPMDSMFYPGDDYTKDMGKNLSDTLSYLKEKLESIPDKAIAELPNLDEILENVNNFFGGNVLNMSESEIKNKISTELGDMELNESWIDDYDKFESPHYSDTLDTPLKDVEGGLVQKILSLISKILGINILSFGILGSFILKSLNIITISPIMGMVISIVAITIISIVRRIIYFKNRKKSDTGN